MARRHVPGLPVAFEMRGIARAWVAVAAVSAGLLVVGVAFAKQADRVFYLSVHPRQCVIASVDPSVKTFQVVSCSNSAHNLEVYAVKRGGWGKKPPTLRSQGLIARSVCLRSYRMLTGHGPPRTAGWAFHFADPGAEAARYGDRIICSFRAWPQLAPLGRGWHVR
jgi:hypothetical protein